MGPNVKVLRSNAKLTAGPIAGFPSWCSKINVITIRNLSAKLAEIIA